MSPCREAKSSVDGLTVEKSCQFEHIHIHVLDQIKITGFTRFITGGNQAFKPTNTDGTVDHSIFMQKKAKLCLMQLVLVLVSSRIFSPQPPSSDGGQVYLHTRREKTQCPSKDQNAV